VLLTRLWPKAPPAAVLVPAALAIGLLARPFLLPTPADTATAAVLYDFVRGRGRPILATRPDYTYFVVHQPVEAEGSSLTFLVADRVPGIEILLDRVRRRYYRTIVAVPYYWPNDPGFVAALEGYEMAAQCSIGYFYGQTEFVIFVPRGEGARPAAPPPGARCTTYAAGPGAPVP
jgi:hypothetical protein